MTLGEKIKKLRNNNGLTQKDLADKVHVTFQTVSKWEKDENEPDVATLRELSNIFSCSIDYLLSPNEEEPKKETEVVPVPVVVAAPKEEETTKTIVIHQKELHVCEYCKKDIPEDELEIQHIRVGHGRSHSYRTAYYHKSCLAKKRKEEAEREKAQRNYEAIHNARKCWGWSIPCGIVALVITLICLLNYSEFTTMQTIGISVLAGYGIFGMIYCIVSGSYIGEVFAKCAGFSVHFPGIIFSLDFDGIKFLIIMKLIFAVLGFLIGVFAIIFAILLSATLGGISFPFVLIHNKRNGYDDVL